MADIFAKKADNDTKDDWDKFDNTTKNKNIPVLEDNLEDNDENGSDEDEQHYEEPPVEEEEPESEQGVEENVPDDSEIPSLAGFEPVKKQPSPQIKSLSRVIGNIYAKAWHLSKEDTNKYLEAFAESGSDLLALFGLDEAFESLKFASKLPPFARILLALGVLLAIGAILKPPVNKEEKGGV